MAVQAAVVMTDDSSNGDASSAGRDKEVIGYWRRWEGGGSDLV
jgi:hypothetical protein